VVWLSESFSRDRSYWNGGVVFLARIPEMEGRKALRQEKKGIDAVQPHRNDSVG
jgi:hypothetical protein